MKRRQFTLRAAAALAPVLLGSGAALAQAAKPREGKISNESPLGAAILGKRRNQKVTVNTPSGTMKLTVLKIQ